MDKEELIAMMLRDDYAPGTGMTPAYSEPQAQANAGPPPGAMQVASQFMGGGGGGGSALASAGPWAALAAAIVANETGQREGGNRPDSMSAQLREGLTGEGLVRDVDRLTGDNKFAHWVAEHGNPEGMGRNIEKSLKPWELLEELF